MHPPQPNPPSRARSPRVGVCSWSLRPESPEDLAAQVAAVGVRGVQLALGPLADGRWQVEQTRRALAARGLTILSGMMATAGEDYSTLESIRRTGGLRPDGTWAANLTSARRHAEIARDLGLPLVTLHAGFLPHDAADPERAGLLERLRTVAAVFADQGVRLGLETGQESAGTLLAVLDELPAGVGVNFDPANMILYGMGDPVAALDQLAARVVQVHVKDADPSPTPGQWGTERPAGEGSVDWAAFSAVYHRRGLTCDLVIEREAGAARQGDARLAALLIARHWPEVAP